MNFSFKYDGKKYTKRDFEKFENKYVLELNKGISVTAVCDKYDKYDAESWVLWFENNSDNDSKIFSEINDCDINYTFIDPEISKPGYMPGKAFPCVTKMNGIQDHSNGNYAKNDKNCAVEFTVDDVYVLEGENVHFESYGSRSSDGTMPFFDIHTENDGMILAVGWTGGWKSDFERNDSCLSIKTGLKHTKFYLKHGEKIRTSSVLVMNYLHEDKYNKFRKLIKEYFSHKSHNKEARNSLVAFELWGALSTDEMIKRLNELKSHNIGAEDIWIDAGWYGDKTESDCPHDSGWENETGNWVVNTDAHPDGFYEVSNAAINAGANLMLWFEPERAVKGTPMTVMHPEWFLTSSENDVDLLINYGVDEAFDYIFDTLCNYIENLKLSCYRQDFNRCPYLYFTQHDEKNREGITEIKHIMGMYRLWDMMLEKYPYLIIDNCSAGGRRIDIETLKRSIPFFRTDYLCAVNGNPEVHQVHNSGISKYIPFSGGVTKVKGDVYTYRSSYSSSWGSACYNTMDREMSDADFESLKFAVDEYKSISNYLCCDFYNHASESFDDTSWAIWQYHDDEKKEGVILAFRRSNSPFESVTITLDGVGNNATILYEDKDKNESYEKNEKLCITLPRKRSSALIKYKVI